jgi:hypothetical protein
LEAQRWVQLRQEARLKHNLVQRLKPPMCKSKLLINKLRYSAKCLSEPAKTKRLIVRLVITH